MWSPDSKLLAYGANRGNGEDELFVVPIGAGAPTAPPEKQHEDLPSGGDITTYWTWRPSP